MIRVRSKALFFNQKRLALIKNTLSLAFKFGQDSIWNKVMANKRSFVFDPNSAADRDAELMAKLFGMLPVDDKKRGFDSGYQTQAYHAQ